LAKGTLVPEAVVFKLVNDKLAQLRTEKHGVILDGFPRSREQARGWIERAKQQPPNLAVQLKLPEELLVQKLLGRRTCSVCGDLYNVYSFQEGQYSMPAMLPKREGHCDKCGGSLVKRVDDTMSVIRDRLRSHWETERELIEYIGNNCGEVVGFDVTTGIAQVDELSLLIRGRLGLS
jgi:adenylate kinase